MPQSRVALPAADIHSKNAPRSAREQDFGEAAGGRTDIEADAAGNID